MSSVLVFDGDCAFCSACVRFGQRLLHADVDWVPWQFADLDALGLARAQVIEAVQWIGADQHRASGAAAVAALLRASGPRYAWVGWLLERWPVRALAEPVYRLIARNRHRLPGGTPACALPRA